jgi:hypothetical protein
MKIKLYLILFTATLLNSCIYTEKTRLTIVQSGTPVLLSSSDAKVDGTLVDLSGELTEYGHCWSDKRNPTVQNEVASYKVKDKKSNGTTEIKDGIFTSTITNLQPNTTYYVRAYAVTGNEIVYSLDVETGQTGTASPELSVKNISQVSVENISKTQATFKSAVAGTSTREISDYGFVYSKDNKTPTLANATKVSLFDSSQPKIGAINLSLSKVITGLTAGTTYYISAYVVTTKSGNNLELYTRTTTGEGTAMRTASN